MLIPPSPPFPFFVVSCEHSKSHTSGRETSVRLQGCFLSGRLLWRQVYFRTPTPRTTFEYMTVMEKAIEHCGDGGTISQ